MARLPVLTAEGLRHALLVACEHAQRVRAELNRINVFPVPDGDTGTNFALTLAAVAEHLRRDRSVTVGAVAQRAAEAAVLGARGNCGLIFSQFLLGFAQAVRDKARLRAAEIGPALRAAVRHVYAALDRPLEGTMLTVLREVAEEAERVRLRDLQQLLPRLLDRARDALRRTPELLPVLRRAGVVDAGAKGVVHFLEGLVAAVAGDPLRSLAEVPSVPEELAASPLAVTAVDFAEAASPYRFCTEIVVESNALPSEEEVRQRLRDRGDSLVVAVVGGMLKVHIHTDAPEEVLTELRALGRVVAHKAEDMGAQHATVRRAATARRTVAVVADSGCDLPEAALRTHGIRLVPLQLVYPDRTLRDRVDIDPEEFIGRLLAGDHPSTSQPPPAAFQEAFTAAAVEAETIVAVLIARALSGTYDAAKAVLRHAPPPVPVHLVDSRGASLAEGFLALRAAELAEAGWDPTAIVAELHRLRDHTGLFFSVDVFDYLLASGRVSRGRAWLGKTLDIKPILGLDSTGRIVPLARVRHRRNVLPKMLELLDRSLPRGASRLRMGILHVAAPEMAEAAAEELRRRYAPDDLLVVPAAAVLATHVGPGAWGIVYQVVDGERDRQGRA